MPELKVAAQRIQTRLSKKGVKKSLSEIRDFLNKSQDEDVTEEEINKAVSFFLNIPGELVEFNAKEKALAIAKTYFLDLAPSQLEELSLMGSEEEIKKAIYELINLENKQSEEEENKGELITHTAKEMGITLTPEEVYLVAQEINTSSDSLEDSLEEIKTAIINFINYKVQANSQKIAEAMKEITLVATSGLNKNSQELKQGLNNVNGILKGGVMDFKRISQAFAINKA
jgi:hypothetical protein